MISLRFWESLGDFTISMMGAPSFWKTASISLDITGNIPFSTFRQNNLLHIILNASYNWVHRWQMLLFWCHRLKKWLLSPTVALFVSQCQNIEIIILRLWVTLLSIKYFLLLFFAIYLFLLNNYLCFNTFHFFERKCEILLWMYSTGHVIMVTGTFTHKSA